MAERSTNRFESQGFGAPLALDRCAFSHIVRYRLSDGRFEAIACKLGKRRVDFVYPFVGQRSVGVAVGHAEGEAPMSVWNLVTPIEVEQADRLGKAV